MELTADSLCICVQCGVLVDGDHPCEMIPPTELDCLGSTVAYILRGEMIRQRAQAKR